MTMDEAVLDLVTALLPAYPNLTANAGRLVAISEVLEAAGVPSAQVRRAGMRAAAGSRFFPSPGEIVAAWREEQPNEEQRQARFRELAEQYRDAWLFEGPADVRGDRMAAARRQAQEEGFYPACVALKGGQAAADVQAARERSGKGLDGVSRPSDAETAAALRDDAGSAVRG